MDNAPASPKASKTTNGVKPPDNPTKDGAPSAGEKKLSGPELKKLKQAEKHARRAKERAEKGVQAPPTDQPVPSAKAPKPPPVTKGQAPPPAADKMGAQGWKRRPSAGAGTMQQPIKHTVTLFGSQPDIRRYTIAGASKEVHPAVLALGLQISSYEVCGSTARCVAMLLAFKAVIESYTTPTGISLARHLTNHHLSPQIEFLKSCRPLSTSMGNAIRALKDKIIKIDPSVPEDDAKKLLLDSIDQFIQERITAADALISNSASQKIVDGDVILTFAKSSLVLKTLLKASKSGTRFRVIVLDSAPLFEGRRLHDDLKDSGVEVQYESLSGAGWAIQKASKVFLGAHSMMANGMLLSRRGTSTVAMLAHARDVPVIVCCESVKFTEKVALDSNGTELAPSEELFSEDLGGLSADEKEAEKRRLETIKLWRENSNLYQVNSMYDLTDRSHIRMVVTEYGSLPPSAVPAVLRLLESAKAGA